MITREDMLKVLKKKDRQASKKIREEAEKTVDRCSRAILEGRFKVTTAPTNPEVFNLVRKAFLEEGIDVKMEVKEVESRSKHKKKYDFTHANYIFSIIEEV